MSEPTTSPDAGTGGEVNGYVRVAPSPVTVRGGQGTGDRAGDNPRGEAPEGVPRADAPRGARARETSLAWLSSITQRQHAVGDSRLALTARNLWSGALHDVAAMWLYVRDESWMHGSDNTVLRLGGYAWAILVAIPVMVAARLIAAVAMLAADLVTMLASRFARLIATVAILCAVWLVSPSHHEAPPPTADTEIVFQDGVR